MSIEETTTGPARRGWARSLLLGLALALSGAGAVLAQAGRPVPSRPLPADPYEAARAAFERLPEPERIAAQDALVWTGDYGAVADGAFGRRTFEALQAYQRRLRRPPSGILEPVALTALVAVAARAKGAARFTILGDPLTRVRIGVPEALLPRRSTNPNGGARFQSADGRITLDTRSLPGGEDELKDIYERNLAIQTPGRNVTIKTSRQDSFTIGGETPTGRFMIRYVTRGEAIRGFSLGYDKALAAELDRVAVAISNSFEPFPGGNEAATPAVAGLAPAPPAREEISASTGFAVSPRRVVASAAAIQACREPRIDGGAARLVSVDRALGLALLEPAAPHRTAPFRLAATPVPGPGLVVFASAGEDGRMVATPAEILAGGRVIAPLQDGAAGAIVLDGGGAVAGMVTVLSTASRRVAGLVPPASHAMTEPSSLVRLIGPEAPVGAGEPPRSLGALAASIAPALVRITCAPARPQ